MAYAKKLGVFVRVPEVGQVKTRLIPPLDASGACELYTAFLRDLFDRLGKLKKVSGTVFYTGGAPDGLVGFLPPRYQLVEQEGESLGDRLHNAFEILLDGEGSTAAIIGSDSPDIPIAFVKRAHQKLKHKDVVLGPAFDGGYYLIGLREIVPSIFDGVAWGEKTVLRETLEKVKAGDLAFSLLPPWYDVDDETSLAMLQNMLLAKQIEHGGRLQHTERVLSRLMNHQPK